MTAPPTHESPAPAPWSPLAGSRRLRDAWAAGAATHGPWVASGSAAVVEVVAAAGFDWVVLDAQHGLADQATLPGLLRAAAITRTPTFVRVAANDLAEIGRALDLGANGVIVPVVESVEDAAAAVAACRYPPAGRRSWGPIRGGSYAEVRTGIADADEAAICLVMAETVTACERIEEIVAVPGVDGVFLGPLDLAISAERPPSLDCEDPVVGPLVARVRDACRAAGKVAGTFPERGDTRRWAEDGFQFLGALFDTEVLRREAATRHAAISAGADG